MFAHRDTSCGRMKTVERVEAGNSVPYMQRLFVPGNFWFPCSSLRLCEVEYIMRFEIFTAEKI
jgi:hypothetical protein